MLVSAAAATGEGHDIFVEINSEAIDNCIEGVDVVQAAIAESYVVGCDHDVLQTMDFSIDCNTFIGTDANTDIVQQVGQQVANASGKCNYEDQYIEFDIFDNCVENGNITQAATQDANAVLCDNDIWQTAYADAVCNTLLNSNLIQRSDEIACANGENNYIDQWTDQFAFKNCLETSSLGQVAELDANVALCDNNVIQTANEFAGYPGVCGNNVLVDSLLNQIICEEADVTGKENCVDQFAQTFAVENCLDASDLIQSITSIAEAAGCNNEIDHCITLDGIDNTMIDGKITQVASATSNA
jgi:hypothetical protein